MKSMKGKKYIFLISVHLLYKETYTEINKETDMLLSQMVFLCNADSFLSVYIKLPSFWIKTEQNFTYFTTQMQSWHLPQPIRMKLGNQVAVSRRWSSPRQRRWVQSQKSLMRIIISSSLFMTWAPFWSQMSCLPLCLCSQHSQVALFPTFAAFVLSLNVASDHVQSSAFLTALLHQLDTFLLLQNHFPAHVFHFHESLGLML